MSDDYIQRMAIERPRPLSPQMAMRMIEVLDPAHTPHEPYLVTLDDMEAIYRRGILLKDMLATGTMLIPGISIFDAKVRDSIDLQFGEACFKRDEGGKLTERPWFNQGGNEVHREDNDMLAAQPRDASLDSIIDRLKARRASDLDPENPALVRIRGLKKGDRALGDFAELLLQGKVEWDMQRIKDAAHRYREGGKEK